MDTQAHAVLEAGAIALFDDSINREAGGRTRMGANPNLVAFMEELARAHGLTEERYPAMFEAIRQGTTANDLPTYRATRNGALAEPASGKNAFVDAWKIDYLAAVTGSGAGSAHATVTRASKAVEQMTLALTIVNDTGGVKTLIATGIAKSYLQQTTEVQTDDAKARVLPKTGKNYATLTWSIGYADGTTEGDKGSKEWSYQASKDPTVTAPMINPNRKTGDLNNIMVGLARGFNNPAKNGDVDYWFWQTQVENTTLLVPFSGSMYFNNDILPLDYVNNPRADFFLDKMEGGQSRVPATTPMLQQFKINPTKPRQLDFSFVANPNDAGTSINFGQSIWAANTQTFFTATVYVVFTDGSIGWSSVVSSLKSDTNPTDGVLFIKPIIYVWHCMVAGTQITMSDGTTRTVESLTVGDTVATPNGARQVQATLAQPHYGTVYAITTAGGRSITCSGTHPIATPAGMVQASTLTAGSTVQTINNGTDTVSSIATKQQSGEGLFNLWLAGGSSFYANGLLVGDYVTQVSLLRPDNVEALRARIPEHLRTDFESWAEDREKEGAGSGGSREGRNPQVREA